MSVGTGRDHARTLRLPSDPRDQLARAVNGSLHPFDVGRVTYGEQQAPRVRYFANVAGFGLCGATDRIMARHRSRRLPPKIAFQAAVVHAMLSYRNTAVRFRLDAGPWQQARVKLGAVCNGQFFGAGMRIGPGAVTDDGWFEWVVIGDIGPLTLLRRLPTVYRGEHLGLPGVLLTINTIVCSVQAIKGKWSREDFLLRIAPQIVHIGFLFILLAHLLGAGWGYRISGMLPVETYAKLPDNRALYLKDLRPLVDDRGNLKDWTAAIAVFENDQRVATGILGPNTPLFYKGMGVYLKSFELQERPIAFLMVNKDPGALWALGGSVLFMIGTAVIFALKWKKA